MTTTQPQYRLIRDMLPGLLDHPKPFAEAFERAGQPTLLDEAFITPPTVRQARLRLERAVWLTLKAAKDAGRRVSVHCSADETTTWDQVSSRMVCDWEGELFDGRPIIVHGEKPEVVFTIDTGTQLVVIPLNKILDVEVLP